MALTLEEFVKCRDAYYAQAAAGEVDPKLVALLEPYRVHNAVVMAAGMSTRFAPFSALKPKALAEVRGEILIERQIRQLQAAGIKDIYLVVGYKREQLMYLREKYGVHILVNADYERYNNTATLMCVRSVLSNSYICSSDNYFTDNPFEPYVYRPYYAAVYAEGPTNEYCLSYDEHERITAVTIGGSDAWYMLGHVYFDAEFSRKFIKILQVAYEKQEVRQHLWEDLYRQHLAELILYIRRYPAGMIYEFDSLQELAVFDPWSSSLCVETDNEID